MKTVFVGNHENEWLMQGALHHAEKHIPDLDAVSCYTPADVTKWAESLGKFVEGMDEDYLLLMLDDYWVQEYDAGMVDASIGKINLGAVKVDLSGDRMQFPHYHISPFYVRAKPDAPYRTSLQAAIWRKDYLLRFCQQNWTPWDFEIEGSKMAKLMGGDILGVNHPAIRYINVLRRGEWYGKFDF